MPHTGRARRRTSVVLAVASVYAVVVVLVGLTPSPVDRPFSGLILRGLRWLHARGLPDAVDYALVEFSANIAFFVPFGVIAALLLPRYRLVLATALGLLGSLGIECAQWLLLPARVPSAFDVLANTLGAVLGAGIAVLATRRRA